MTMLETISSLVGVLAGVLAVTAGLWSPVRRQIRLHRLWRMQNESGVWWCEVGPWRVHIGLTEVGDVEYVCEACGERFDPESIPAVVELARAVRRFNSGGKVPRVGAS